MGHIAEANYINVNKKGNIQASIGKEQRIRNNREGKGE